MKRLTIILALLGVIFSGAASGQPPARNYYYIAPIVIDGDTIPQMVSLPLYKFSWRKGRKQKPMSQQEVTRLIYNVKKVYPIAKEANRRLQEMEAHMLTLPTEKERDAYTKQAEKDLKKEYTPVLKNMTFSQGKILIKLIDRETSETSYELVRRLRNGFTAFFWQGIARIFGANLKDTYQVDGEDKAIEQIILLYEAGMI